MYIALCNQAKDLEVFSKKKISQKAYVFRKNFYIPNVEQQYDLAIQIRTQACNFYVEVKTLVLTGQTTSHATMNCCGGSFFPGTGQ